MTRTRARVEWATLLPGIAVPLIYYGIQAAAAPAFPGFSFVGTTASELGSDLSLRANWFNVGIMVQGVATLVAAVGFLMALLRLRVHPALAVPTAAAVAMSGVQTLWAGFFPMPDPRHGGHPAFIIGMLLLPLLLTACIWSISRSGALRAYFLLTLLLLAVMFPVMAGLTGIDTQAYRGLVQRIFTLTIFPPIGVAAAVLARRTWPGNEPGGRSRAGL